MKKPHLFKYVNYRIFLADWFAWMKATKPEFSYRAFSKWAGFRSPNQLLLVIKGQRNVSPASVGKYFKVLKFKETEQTYFELLVKFNQAKDMLSKQHYFKQLSRHWLKRGRLLKKEQYHYLSKWYYTVIREMVNLKDFKENGYWIARRLKNLITPAQARKAIRILLDLHLLRRDQKNKLVQVANYVTTGDEVESVAAYLFHEQMIRLALESLKGTPSTQRNITTLTFTVAPGDYDMLVSNINEFRKEMVSSLQNRERQDEDERLYQLNIHLFPLTGG